MRFSTVACVLAFLVLLPAVSAKGAEPMPPSGKWNVDFGDAHCVASRSYGPPGKTVTLVLKPSPIGDVMQLSVLRANASKVVDQYDGSLTIDGHPPIPVSMLGYGLAASDTRVSLINLPLATFNPIRKATKLRVQMSGGVDATFILSQIEPVARALDACVTGLRALWHIGEAESGIKQKARALKPFHSLISTADYPRVALRDDSGGTVTLVVLVAETGKVASCMVTGTSGHASLDAQSCVIMTTRAKYDPALGPDGKAMKSGITTRIRWEIPGV